MLEDFTLDIDKSQQLTDRCVPVTGVHRGRWRYISTGA